MPEGIQRCNIVANILCFTHLKCILNLYICMYMYTHAENLKTQVPKIISTFPVSKFIQSFFTSYTWLLIATLSWMCHSTGAVLFPMFIIMRKLIKML